MPQFLSAKIYTNPARQLHYHGARVMACALAPLIDTVPLSIATGAAIRTEQLTRRALRAGRPSRSAAGRLAVNCHEGGSGEALLLLNGLSASGLVWPKSMIERLEQRFHVLRIDARGSGWSRGAPQPFTIADLADDAVAILRTSGHRQAVVAGLSMGGMVAQEVAIRHPDVVSRLVLLATRPPVPGQVGSSTAVMALTATAPPNEQRSAEYVRALWSGFTAPDFAGAHPEVIDEIVAAVMARVTTRAGLFNQARAATAWRGPRRLQRIRTPTTVVHGNRDVLIPVGNGARLAELIPAARYVELANVGHLIPYEAPEVFARVIEECLTAGGGVPTQ